MTDDLRTKIAKRLHWMYADSASGKAEPDWDDESPMVQDDWLRDADAVIRELPELSTPIYQCPVCRHAYHYCSCHGGRR